jgi:hypothetical protein
MVLFMMVSIPVYFAPVSSPCYADSGCVTALQELAIGVLTPELLRQPIPVVPQVLPENEDDLHCQIYRRENLVVAPYDEQTDWKQVSKTAFNTVRMAANQGRTQVMPGQVSLV